MRANLERRLAQLEADAKSPMIVTWTDLMLWLDEHEDVEDIVGVDLCPELQIFVHEMLSVSGQ
jgi:hypothetical protein